MNSKFMEWLKDFKGAFNDASFEALGGSGAWNDRFYNWLVAKGVAGAADDMLHGWLAGMGYSGSVNDMLNQFVPIPPVDLNDLLAAISEAEAIDPADFTPNSYAPLDAAKEHGLDVVDDPSATQGDVDAAADAIREAIVNLVPRADTSGLIAAIAAGEAVDGSQYTEQSYAVLLAAISDGRVVEQDANATQAQVDAAEQGILDAINSLVPKPAPSCDVVIGDVPAPGITPMTVVGNSVTISWEDEPDPAVFASQFRLDSPVVPGADPIVWGFSLDSVVGDNLAGVRAGLYKSLNEKITITWMGDSGPSEYAIVYLDGVTQANEFIDGAAAFMVVESDGTPKFFDGAGEEVTIGGVDVTGFFAGGYFGGFECEIHANSTAGEYKASVLTATDDMPMASFPTGTKNICGQS